MSNGIIVSPAKGNCLLFLISAMILSIFSIGIYSGSAPVRPNMTAKSVACPFPVSESEPNKSTLIRMTLPKMFSSRSSFKKRSAPRQGPKVWELDGPTPILSISNTEIHSSIVITRQFYANIIFLRLRKRCKFIKCALFLDDFRNLI
ncbi:hypothetical protein D3C86_1367190 [compost metagenome]